MDGIQERPSQNEVQSSSLKLQVLGFRNIAPFQSYNASKTTGVENQAKNSHFLTPRKIYGRGGKMSEWINQVQPMTEPLIYFCRVAAARISPEHV